MVDLLCMGEPMLEFNQLPPQPDGAVHYLEGHGGDTSNAAVAAARHGRVGGLHHCDRPGRAGRQLHGDVGARGVDVSTVIRTDRAQTGVYFVTHDAAGSPFPALPHQLAGRALCGVPTCRARRSPRRRLFFVSGISQGISTSAADAVFAAIDVAKEHGVKVAYDTNYRPRLWPPARAAAVMHAAIAQSDYVFPGMEDALVLTGLADPDEILDFYLSLGCPVVALKMGDRGAYARRWRASRAHPGHAVNAVDATGAGDTFCGTFLARILAGDTPEHAARYANVAAALKCTGYGAVAPIPRPEQVLRLLAAAR